MPEQIALNVLLGACVYAVIGVSFALIYNAGGFFHLGHGISVASGGYFVCLLHLAWGMPLVLAACGAVVLVAGIGVLMDIGVFSLMRSRGASSTTQLIASMGIYVVLENTIALLWGNAPVAMHRVNVIEGGSFFGAKITVPQLWSLIVGVATCVVVGLFLARSRLGKAIRALSCNAELLAVFGLRSRRLFWLVFAIGSGVAGVAGILRGLQGDLEPTMGFTVLLYGVIAMIVGGGRRVHGIAIGAVLLAAAQHVGIFYLGSEWMDGLAFVVLIGFLAVRPRGVVARRLREADV